MKLYEIPRGSKIRAESFDQFGNKLGDVITFHNLDGMYSYCSVDGMKGNNSCHLAANQELELGKDGIYDIA